jgi:hypothetical protein
MTERTWKQNLLAVPGIGLSLLPKVACPACWPAYAGLLSSLGLGFLVSTAYLLPMTAAFLFWLWGCLGSAHADGTDMCRLLWEYLQPVSSCSESFL